MHLAHIKTQTDAKKESGKPTAQQYVLLKGYLLSFEISLASVPVSSVSATWKTNGWKDNEKMKEHLAPASQRQISA